MTIHAMPSAEEYIDDLIESFWCGKIGEAEFMELGLEAGMSIGEINDMLQEVRDEDGGLT